MNRVRAKAKANKKSGTPGRAREPNNGRKQVASEKEERQWAISQQGKRGLARLPKERGDLGMLKEGKARLFIAGVLPVAIYGVEHEPWAEAEIAVIEKQAVKALQVRSPGVPHALARLMLLVVADPMFRVHIAAVERWSREV